MNTVSVIVPTLDEESVVADTLRRARQPGVHELIVADGGSCDATRAIASPLADVVLSAPRGRAAFSTRGMAGAGCSAADFNADKRPDVVCTRFGHGQP